MLKKGIILLSLIITIILIININSDEKVVSTSSDVTNYDRYSTNDYYGFIKIPSINMNLGFYEYDNPLNDVAYNVEWIEIPVSNSYLFAAHSGTGEIAYFNPLRDLEVGDDIYLEIDDETKHFVVSKVYRTIKDGSINISSKNNMIYLTTCDQIVKGYQLVIEGTLS